MFSENENYKRRMGKVCVAETFLCDYGILLHKLQYIFAHIVCNLPITRKPLKKTLANV